MTVHVNPFLMKPKSYLFRALSKYKFSNRYSRFIFDINLDSLCFSLLRVAWDVSFSWLNVPSGEERLGLFSKAMVASIVNF